MYRSTTRKERETEGMLGTDNRTSSETEHDGKRQMMRIRVYIDGVCVGRDAEER